MNAKNRPPTEGGPRSTAGEDSAPTRVTGTIRAIPTRYGGVDFRSKLEAGWAKTFDHYGIEWVYEPEAFTLPSGRNYLPDFWLPGQDTWVEVKGLGVPGTDKAKEFRWIMSHKPDCLQHFTHPRWPRPVTCAADRTCPTWCYSRNGKGAPETHDNDCCGHVAPWQRVIILSAPTSWPIYVETCPQCRKRHLRTPDDYGDLIALTDVQDLDRPECCGRRLEIWWPFVGYALHKPITFQSASQWKPRPTR